MVKSIVVNLCTVGKDVIILQFLQFIELVPSLTWFFFYSLKSIAVQAYEVSILKVLDFGNVCI